MKGYSTFLKAPGLEPQHQMFPCHIQDIRWEGVLPLCRDAVGVFYRPSQLRDDVKVFNYSAYSASSSCRSLSIDFKPRNFNNARFMIFIL